MNQYEWLGQRQSQEFLPWRIAGGDGAGAFVTGLGTKDQHKVRAYLTAWEHDCLLPTDEANENWADAPQLAGKRLWLSLDQRQALRCHPTSLPDQFRPSDVVAAELLRRSPRPWPVQLADRPSMASPTHRRGDHV
ncbi:hypothetical protein V7793_18170 [Streptomyces sp. KLMMK]|uniref:hypothetical protein n=1 Tax=Streptomyces sp. KLMMK TaxID=3109353 RepID=UPI0030099F95